MCGKKWDKHSATLIYDLHTKMKDIVESYLWKEYSSKPENDT